jgi:hypothetical protein
MTARRGNIRNIGGHDDLTFSFTFSKLVGFSIEKVTRTTSVCGYTICLWGVQRHMHNNQDGTLIGSTGQRQHSVLDEYQRKRVNGVKRHARRASLSMTDCGGRGDACVLPTDTGQATLTVRNRVDWQYQTAEECMAPHQSSRLRRHACQTEVERHSIAGLGDVTMTSQS